MNILVVTLSNIGDVVMTTPVIVALKEAYPKAHITVVCGPKAQGLLSGSADIDELVIYDKKAKLKDKWAFIQGLKNKKYDLAVDLRNSMIPWLVRAKRKSPLFRKFKNVNKRDCHLEVLEMMKIPSTPSRSFIFFNDDDELSLKTHLKKFGVDPEGGWIIAAPGAASEKKRWDAENYREVLSTLSAGTDKLILLAGDPNERKIAEEVAKGASFQSVILAGETSLREVAALIGRASLLICNDSAMMHLGFELGTPTVGVFGPTDHKKYGHSSDTFKVVREDPKPGEAELGDPENRSFYGLSTSKVLQACEQLLGGCPAQEGLEANPSPRDGVR